MQTILPNKAYNVILINWNGELLRMYKICVYAICKNEQQYVDRWMDVVSEADLVVVTDTGSTDDTVEKLRARGAIVYTETVKPWRFDEARNIALSHVPEDIDICVSNDLDEVFVKGWRKKLEDGWQMYQTQARYLFNCSYNADGTPNKQHIMEKIHSRNYFRWIRPVHESLEYYGQGKNSIGWINDLVLNHYPDLSKTRSQYLPLLELSAQENPDDDRVAFWLGREYMYYGEYDKSILILKKHVKMPSAMWDEERCASMRYIANCYKLKGDLKEARSWLYAAITECPRIREPYLDMVKLGYIENDWSLMLHMVNDALKITEKSGSYLLELEAWGYSFYDYGAIACYQLEMYQKANEYGEKACEMAPDNDRLRQNLVFIKIKLQ